MYKNKEKNMWKNKKVKKTKEKLNVEKKPEKIDKLSNYLYN